MQLVEVTLEDLSSIRHKVFLSPCEDFSIPEFKIISFQGIYGHESAGKKDAKYLVASIKAAHEAWYTAGTIFDFSELSYEWGDEMDWVLDCLDRSPTNCIYPLAIVVGQKSDAGLRSLLNNSYKDLCYEKTEDAINALRHKIGQFELCLREWRSNTRPKA